MTFVLPKSVTDINFEFVTALKVVVYMHVSLQNIGTLNGKLPVRSLRDIICKRNPYPKLYLNTILV